MLASALSLVGKVHYFWGGKSYSIGPDPKWGELTEVESGGSSTTGEMRPYGLDCSGFVAWCFLQQGLTNEELESQVGLGTWAQWENSEEISWKELRVGDIVFQNAYPTNKGNHIGICIGFNEKGKPVFAHCALGFDNVVVTPAGGRVPLRPPARVFQLKSAKQPSRRVSAALFIFGDGTAYSMVK